MNENEPRSNAWKNNSSDNEQTTRAKVKRKQPKKKVGITLPTYIIEESRT